MTLEQINKNLLTACTYKFLEKINLNYNKQESTPSKEIAPLIEDDESTIVKYLSIVDRCSLNISDDNKDMIFASASLLSELYAYKFNNINSYIRTIFLRLGLAPSALTLQMQKEKFDALPSVFDELELGTIIEDKYQVDIAGKTFYLTQEQKNIWEQLNGGNKEVLISAPTSSGKSFLLAEYIVKQYNETNNFKAMYIVSTLSLINQVKRDLSVLNQEMNIKTHIPDSITEDKIVLILTQDKAISLTSFPQNVEWDCVVFDEVHNIFQNFSTLEEGDEEIFSQEATQDKLDERSLIYRFLIEWFIDQSTYKKIVLSGPNIKKGLDDLQNNHFSGSIKSSNIKSSPVLKILFSFKNAVGKSILNASLLIEKEVHVSIHLSKKMSVFSSGSIRSKSTCNIRSQLITCDPTTTILSLSPSPTTSTTVISNNKQKINPPLKDRNIEILQNLKEYFCAILHCEEKHLPEFGFDLDNKNVVHHGSLPSHIRLCIEIAAKEGLISHLSTTSTLLQGMNFPIKYLIASDAGNISSKRKSEKQLETKRQPYSIPQFKNILGRSGRLMKDLVGYGIILDEDQTREDLGIEGDLGSGLLSDDSSQELNDLNEDRKDTIQCAMDNKQISMQQYSPKIKQKAILIRRYILNNTDFNKCQQLLKKRGINLTQENYNSISQILPTDSYIKALVNKQYHLFDPLDMVHMIEIYNSKLKSLDTNILNMGNLIKTIWNIVFNDESLKGSLDHKFNYLIKNNSDKQGKLHHIIDIATQWVSGKSWSEIWQNSIVESRTENGEKKWVKISVSEFIKNEQSKKISSKMKEFTDKINLVSFHLPRLLKPWIDIDDYYKSLNDPKHTSSIILGALEHGLTDPKHYDLLSHGWHREIILDKQIQKWLQIQKDFLDGKSLTQYFPNKQEE